MWNIVDELLLSGFESLSYERKKEVVARGRPEVKLNWVEKCGQVSRSFNNDQFRQRPWLTAPGEGPPRLICWPCLLFKPKGVSQQWISTGQTDLKRYTTACNRHVKTKVHLDAILLLHHFGTMEAAQDHANQASLHRFNATVTRNRQVLKRLVDITVFLAKQGLAFRGHDESGDSANRGNYVESVGLLAEYDQLLKDHLLSESSQFKGTSQMIQNDLIKCVHDVLTEIIQAEIEEAEFVAIGADETTDVSCVEQLVMTVRYVDKKGASQERFLGFQAMEGRHDAEAVAGKVLSVCEKIGACEARLVSQSYDGAAVMSGSENGVRAKVQEKYPYAAFLHCMAHRLNLVLMDSATVPEVKRFFCAVRAFHTFFTRSAKRMHLLQEKGSANRMCAGSDTRWQYLDRAVHAVKENMVPLRDTLETITQEWLSDHEAVASALGLLSYLNSTQFVFLLVLFDDIFKLTGQLFAKLQSRKLDVTVAVSSISDCTQQLSQLRSGEEFSKKLAVVEKLVGQKETQKRPLKRKEWGDSVTYGSEPLAGSSRVGDSDSLLRVHHAALDQCTESLRARFCDHGVLSACELLDPARYSGFTKTFPTAQAAALEQHYGPLFEMDALTTELRSVWGFRDMALSPADLVRHMKQQGLVEAFPQTHRLCLLILTIKPTTVGEERAFSVLKRVKNYLRSTTGQDRLTHLSKLQIEAKMLVQMQRDGSLHDRVIDRFGSMKDRAISLFFR